MGRVSIYRIASNLQAKPDWVLATVRSFGEYVASARSTVEEPIARRVGNCWRDLTALEQELWRGKRKIVTTDPIPTPRVKVSFATVRENLLNGLDVERIGAEEHQIARYLADPNANETDPALRAIELSLASAVEASPGDVIEGNIRSNLKSERFGSLSDSDLIALRRSFLDAVSYARLDPEQIALREWLLEGTSTARRRLRRQPRLHASTDPLSETVDPLSLDRWQSVVWAHGQQHLKHALEDDVARWKASGLTLPQTELWLNAGADVKRPFTAALLEVSGIDVTDAFRSVRQADGTQPTLFWLVAARAITVTQAKELILRQDETCSMISL